MQFFAFPTEKRGANDYIHLMNKLQKIIAGIGGLGVLALALWIGTILFVVLLVALPLLALYGRWRMGKMRKEFEAHRARRGAASGPEVIDADYVVIDETPPTTPTDRRGEN